jgi:hypothetical protein
MTPCVQYASFLIRLWRSFEPEDIVPAQWQSEVEHIQSGRCWKFATLAEMEEFFRHQAADPQGLDWIEMREDDLSRC